VAAVFDDEWTIVWPIVLKSSARRTAERSLEHMRKIQVRFSRDRSTAEPGCTFRLASASIWR
jgi:hypothetical protein